MLLGIIFCFLAILWLGTAVMLGITIYDCWGLLSRFTTFLLICGVVASLVECVLVACLGVTLIVGCH